MPSSNYLPQDSATLTSADGAPLKAARVAVIGGANMDICAQSSATLVTGDSNPGRISYTPGGVARNVSENLARLGHFPSLVSAVGNDVFGRRLLEYTQEAGVDVSEVLCLPGLRTSTYLAIHGWDGDMAIAVNDMEIIEQLDPLLLKPLLPSLRAVTCIVLDCNLAPTTLAYLLPEVGTAPVFVDAVSAAKCARISPWLTRIHLLKVNRLEAQMLSGKVVDSVASARIAAAQLHASGVGNVVVSLGVEGVCWCDALGVTGHRGSHSVPVINTSGAGDAMLAGLVHGYLQNMPLVQAIEFAMACAEITLSSTFANAPELSVHAVQSRLISTLSQTL